MDCDFVIIFVRRFLQYASLSITVSSLTSGTMAVAGIDAKFINSIARGLKSTTPKYIHAHTRSSVAVIFRFGDGVNDGTSNRNEISSLFPERSSCAMDPVEVSQRLLHNMKLDAPSNLQVLFLKRADIDDDRWSGAVSFPGGRRDVDDDNDFSTVKREAYEELGVPLDSPDFILLGKLPDYKIMSRQTINEGVVQSRFVFLHVGGMAPTVKFASHEVEAIQWYPLAKLNHHHVEKKRVMHNVTQFLKAKTPDSRLLASELFGGTYAYFPSLRINNRWNVWGLPLRTVSELLEMDGRPAIDWPLFRVSNPLYQFFIVDAYHGYRELSDKMPRKYPRHQLALFCDIAAIVCVIFTIAEMINNFGWLMSIVTGVQEDVERKQRIEEFWKKNTSSPH